MEKISIGGSSVTIHQKNEMGDGHTYAVIDRKTSGMPMSRTQDKYQMVILKGNRIVYRIGSHPKKTGDPTYMKYDTVADFKKDLGSILQKFSIKEHLDTDMELKDNENVNEDEQDFTQHRQLVNHALNDEPAQMTSIFGDMMKDRIADHIETRRTEIGSRIFNGEE